MGETVDVVAERLLHDQKVEPISDAKDGAILDAQHARRVEYDRDEGAPATESVSQRER